MSYETPVHLRPLTDNTNTALLADEGQTQLARYLKTAGVFKCPSDQSYAIHAGGRYPRARSYAMNGHVGESSRQNDPFREYDFYKMDDFTRPGPSQTIVFLEEHEDSINDGYFLVTRVLDALPWGWNAVPASRHNRGANFSFADGHVERHRWKDKRTLLPITRSFPTGVNQPNNPDVAWVVDHATALK